MKLLLAAMLAGGAGGLWLGKAAPPKTADERWVAEAKAALTGDKAASDVERAMFVVQRYLEVAPAAVPAQQVLAALRTQQQCRRAFEEGEHALTNHAPDDAKRWFSAVGAECELHDFAVTRLEQIAGP